MIYLDTSAALAHLLAEEVQPPPQIWRQALIASRLLEYEIWTRIHALQLTESHGDLVRTLLGRVSLLELAPPVLERALQPFPAAVRTLDAIHLASMEFLRDRGQTIELASFDKRLLVVARLLRFRVHAAFK